VGTGRTVKKGTPSRKTHFPEGGKDKMTICNAGFSRRQPDTKKADNPIFLKKKVDAFFTFPCLIAQRLSQKNPFAANRLILPSFP
jgi:hypothetical protein